ncbi:3-ketodihydrosphingosine reductase-like protein [Phanerochaete sordida]|uniref:3-ketodihydrosphingosine reductase-like protein n=1 Tax=Phanerochaete sordida TaxID=48140 RepID=A0A9P3GGW9_9APHY|nr:3-ketodihydrosphingosine reductase-like protein [Phanerochaete sordida]
MFSAPVVVAACFALASTWAAANFLFRKTPWGAKGKHCVVTGGSAGLGLALAVLLAKEGAHVHIVARNQERLAAALRDVEAARQSPDQVFKTYSYALDSAKEAEACLDAVSAASGGRCPDALFLCAGKSRPGFWVERTEEELRECMEETYWVQAWPALAASKRMVRSGVHGKLVFTSSVLGYFSMVGYSPYSPGKFAVRGLAEALQSEFLLYGISVHIAFPGTIFSPGFAEENKVKPKITLRLEETDVGSAPAAVAAHVLRGVRNGRFHITYDFIGNVFRCSSRGSSPGNGGLVDQVYVMIGMIGLPLWRRDVDKEVRKHTEEHYDYLRSKGLVQS